MKKVLKIEGMMCSHCTGRVDKALNDMDGSKGNRFSGWQIPQR